MKKIILLSIVILLVILAGLSLSGTFDKKYTLEELQTNFQTHEKAFEALEAYFVARVPKDRNVSFYLKGGDEISLYIYPEVIDPKNKIIGASEVEIDDPA